MVNPAPLLKRRFIVQSSLCTLHPRPEGRGFMRCWVKQIAMQKKVQQKMHRQTHINIDHGIFFNSLSLKLNLWRVTFFLFFLLAANTIWAAVTASTSRSVISIDETIELVIKSDKSSDDPNLSILENNFQIMGRSQSQNYSLINGNASSTHTWKVTLLPKKTGEITIPAIKVGNEATNPVHLVIKKQSKNPGIDGKDVYLKIALSGNSNMSPAKQESYYVQQQIIVTVQLFHRIRFSNATLSDLKIENTVVEKLANDANYSKDIAGNRYNIIERRYAIYPQQSGQLTIPSLTFSGNAEISQSFSLFSRPGRQIISRTKPLTVNILAIPGNYTGKNWLPAESLEIKSEILEDISTIIAGEAITRHIIVRAKGLLGSQLPVSSVSSSKTIKAYPDKEELKNQLVSGEIFGVRRDTVAIIPLKPGSFTLPEITINWWNTKTNQQESSHLPARSLFAQPNSEQAEQIQSNQQSSQSQVQTQLKKSTDTAEKQTEKTIETIIQKELVYKQAPLTKNLWFWVSIALLIIWLTTLTLLITTATRSKRSAATPSASEKTPSDNSRADKTLQLIYDACKNNNAHNASKSLVQWAKFHFKQPMIAGLSAVIELIDNDLLIDAIVNLESCQYSQDKEKWQGEDLSSKLKQYLQQNNAEKEADKNKASQAFSSLNP